jgi:hypothetical protein
MSSDYRLAWYVAIAIGGWRVMRGRMLTSIGPQRSCHSLDMTFSMCPSTSTIRITSRRQCRVELWEALHVSALRERIKRAGPVGQAA